MAEFLNLSYTYVALASITPALLYYVGLLLAVHFEAKRLGLSGIAKENIPNAMVVIKEQGHLVLPLVSLIGLMFAGFTPLYAAVISIFVTIGASWLRKDTRMGPAKILEAVVEGSKSAISVGVCCVIIGIIIGTVTLTSMGLNMGYLILSIVQGDHIYLAGFLVMIMSAILGMGVPGVPACRISRRRSPCLPMWHPASPTLIRRRQDCGRSALGSSASSSRSSSWIIRCS